VSPDPNSTNSPPNKGLKDLFKLTALVAALLGSAWFLNKLLEVWL
jgi:hypothetical protein